MAKPPIPPSAELRPKNKVLERLRDALHDEDGGLMSPASDAPTKRGFDMLDLDAGLNSPHGSDPGVLNSPLRGSAQNITITAGGGERASAAEMEEKSNWRWIGGKACEMDNHLIQRCTQGSEAGRPTDVNFHFMFLQKMDGGLEKLGGSITSLDLSCNNIREMGGLKAMTKLKELKLYSCQFSRIQNLEECPMLLSLHLEDNFLTEVSGLDGCRYLEYLNLDSNRLRKLGGGLVRLTKLKELHLSHNRLESLDGLQSLVNLETFAADSNGLKSIEASHLAGMTKLDELHLSQNQISSLNFLRNVLKNGKQVATLPSLSSLHMQGNQLNLASLRTMPPLAALQEFYLARNQVDAIPTDFGKRVESLEILDLADNQLTDVSSIERLASISALCELRIDKNPYVCSDNLEEIRTALKKFPALEYVDETPLPKAPESEMTVDDVESPKVSARPSMDQTFRLTAGKLDGVWTRAVFSEAVAAANGDSRPSTASERPPSSGGRPGSSGSLKNPLMHAQTKMKEKRFINLAELEQWESNTLNSLSAIEKQVEKTLKSADNEMTAMKGALKRAQQAMDRERQRQAQHVDEDIAAGLDDDRVLGTAGVPSADELHAMSPHSAMIVLKGGIPPIKEVVDVPALPGLKRANEIRRDESGYATQEMPVAPQRGGLRCLQQAMEFSKEEALKEDVSVEATPTLTSLDSHRSNASQSSRKGRPEKDSTAAEAESQLQAMLHDAQLDAQLHVERVKNTMSNTGSRRPSKKSDKDVDPTPLGVDLRASRKLNKKMLK